MRTLVSFVVTALAEEGGREIIGEFEGRHSAEKFEKDCNRLGAEVERYCSDCQRLMCNCECDV